LEGFARPVAADVDLDAYLSSAQHPYFGVDPELLGAMVREVGTRPGTLVLAGWSQYAKHLVNLFAVEGGVLAIADDERAKKGWHFRSVPVVGTTEAIGMRPDRFVLTNVENRVCLLGAITTDAAYRGQEIHCFPSPYSSEGRYYFPWRHSAFYRALGPSGPHRPPTLLEEGELQFLVETLKQTLHLPGDVLEVGAGQGGSAYALAKLLAETGSDKRLVMLDLFEALPRANPEAIMCQDEVRDWLSFYPQAEIVAGDVDERPEPITEGNWCFVHYDMGFRGNRLARLFGRLQPGGIVVLDNYGNIAANPGRFDAWFAERGHRVSTVPTSSQGWVVKHRPPRSVVAPGR
jgi:SAM-dependent methyltransferase